MNLILHKEMCHKKSGLCVYKVYQRPTPRCCIIQLSEAIEGSSACFLHLALYPLISESPVHLPSFPSHCSLPNSLQFSQNLYSEFVATYKLCLDSLQFNSPFQLLPIFQDQLQRPLLSIKPCFLFQVKWNLSIL